MKLFLNTNSDIHVYVHAKGEQYYLHYNWWPEMPFSYHVTPEDFIELELILKKEIELKEVGCDRTSHAKYFGKQKYLFKLPQDAQNGLYLVFGN